MRATSNSERPSTSASEWRSREPSMAASTSHSNGTRSSVSVPCCSGGGSRGTRRRCDTFEPMRDHSSIRRAASISSASVGKRTGASTAAWYGRTLLEAEVPFRPAQQLEHGLLDLRLELAVELAPGDDAKVHEDVAEPPAVAAVLHAARAVEVGLGDAARPDEARAERLRDRFRPPRPPRRRGRSRPCRPSAAARR